MTRSFCEIVDGINEKIGRCACWLAIPMMVVIIYEVVMRYVFNSPTQWVWDTVRLILLPYVVVSAGYGLVHNVYIRVDFFFVKLSPKAQAWVDVLLTGGLFIFYISILLWFTGNEVFRSWITNERLDSFWGPRVYPSKTIALIGVFLMLLQGVVKIIRDVTEIKTGVFQQRVSGFVTEEEK